MLRLVLLSLALLLIAGGDVRADDDEEEVLTPAAFDPSTCGKAPPAAAAVA